MTQLQPFAALLESYLQRDGRHVRQLAEATGEQFGQPHQVPHNTISRWLRGEVGKPRNWPDIVKLGIVLRLSADEMDQLLLVAGHTSLDHLRQANHPNIVPQLLEPWLPVLPERLQPFQAPPQLSTFTGREEVMGQLRRYLCSQAQHRVCCLLGMAGLGKTSLANQLAYELQTHFVDGVLWLRLDQADTMSALQAIAAAYGLNVSHYTDEATRSSKVRELLAHKQALLVLDNASNDAEIRPLLPPTGACAVLITSRRFDLAVADTAFCLHLRPFDVAKAESLALFARILGAERVRAERDILTQMADQMGHLPLAINIVANRLRHEPGWTAAQMQARLQQTRQRLDLLRRGDQEVRLSFELSYRGLSPANQRLFMALGIFAGGDVAATAAAAIIAQSLEDVEDGLRQLYSLSLVQRGGHGRYQLHPLLQDFSREKCEIPDLPQRYAHYFTTYAQENAGDMPAFQREIGHILAAVQWANQCGLDTAVVRSVLALYPYLQRQGQLAQCRDLLLLAQPAARRDPDQAVAAQILHHLGYTAMKLGEPNQAESYYQEALILAQTGSDQRQAAEILLKLGALAYRRGQLADARHFYQEALPLASAEQSRELVASLLTNLGLVAASEGDAATAIIHYEEALAQVRTLDNRALLITILQNVGLQHEERGDYAQAKVYYEEGLTLAKAENDPELRSRMLGNLGAIACHLGNYAEASGHFRAGLALAESNGLTVQVCRQQANLGQAAMLRGQFRQANVHHQESLALARELGFREDLGMILNQTGDCYLAQDAYWEAATCYTEAMEIAQEGNFARVQALALFGQAQVAAARGNVAEAQRLGQESRQLLQAAGHKKANEVWWWLQELPGGDQ
ncbi:MAG: tetratricopeptide repeat protein [Anaerolineae bacterium]|nr:tetratricopeptide repeat protein [Anaerolineae bacterium]